MRINWFLMWIGGSITRVAGSGLVFGLFFVIYGATPGEAMADLFSQLPPWMTNPWFKLTLFIVGMVIIAASLSFNVWSLRQRKINDLAEDLSWAIHNLLNKPVANNADLTAWETAYHAWCQQVSTKLEDRAFFTRADQLHFDRLGVVPTTRLASSYNNRHTWLVSQLNLKFKRLRDIINWAQMRKR
jgi:hypothetical protein